MKFENWFNVKIDNSKVKMYHINILPSISITFQTDGWYSISLQFLFWTLTFEKE